MWERTEITAGRILCNVCGKPMTAMWEEKNDDCRMRSTVYHCEHCYNDREYNRQFDKDGNVISEEVLRYFFG